MRITLSGIHRKCDDCRRHVPADDLWPTSSGEYCRPCMSSRRGIAKVAGIGFHNPHKR